MTPKENTLKKSDYDAFYRMVGTVSTIKRKNKGKGKAGMPCCRSKDLGD